MSNVETRVDALQRRVVAVEQRAERMEGSFSPTGHYGLLITRHDKMLYVYSSLATVAVMLAAGSMGWLFSAVYELKGDVAAVRTSITTLERGVGRLETRMDGLETRMDGVETRMDGLETRMDGLETRMGGLETRMDGLEVQMGELAAEIKNLSTGLRAELAALRADVRKSADARRR